MKGDRVEILIDAGDGARSFDITASRAGRRVEVATSRGVVHVNEVTRTGQVVRTGRFMSSRVIALVEHPAGDAGRGPAEPRTPRRRKAREEQAETLL